MAGLFLPRLSVSGRNQALTPATPELKRVQFAGIVALQSEIFFIERDEVDSWMKNTFAIVASMLHEKGLYAWAKLQDERRGGGCTYSEEKAAPSA